MISGRWVGGSVGRCSVDRWSVVLIKPVTTHSFCTGGSTHQQWLSESQGHLIYILQDLSGIGDMFGKHY